MPPVPAHASVLILGSHIFAEEVADLMGQTGEHVVAGFVENWDRSRCGHASLLGLPVHWIDDLQALADQHVGVCAIGSTRRRAFIEQAEQAGLRFTTVRHPSAVVSPRATVEEGCIVSARVVIATASRVGAHTILNRGTLIGHHSRIGAFVTVSPGGNVAGCVEIGDGAYIGMGAVILDRVRVGAGAIVGAGAVVTKDVAPGTQVVGVPARVVRTDVDGR